MPNVKPEKAASAVVDVAGLGLQTHRRASPRRTSHASVSNDPIYLLYNCNNYVSRTQLVNASSVDLSVSGVYVMCVESLISLTQSKLLKCFAMRDVVIDPGRSVT